MTSNASDINSNSISNSISTPSVTGMKESDINWSGVENKEAKEQVKKKSKEEIEKQVQE